MKWEKKKTVKDEEQIKMEDKITTKKKITRVYMCAASVYINHLFTRIYPNIPSYTTNSIKQEIERDYPQTTDIQNLSLPSFTQDESITTVLSKLIYFRREGRRREPRGGVASLPCQTRIKGSMSDFS